MKKFILSLFVGFVGIISFCSAGSYTISGQLVGYIGGSYIPVPTKVYSNNGNSKPRVYYTCSFSCDNIYANNKLYKVVGGSEFSIGSFFGCNSSPQVFSVEATAYLIRFDGGSSNYVVDYVCTITGDNIGTTCPEYPTCDPQYTSEQCQSVYGLVSSGLLNSCQSDLNSCQSNTSGFNDLLNNCSNNLNACNNSLTSCLQQNCPVISGDIQRSSLYINDIQHEGSPIIDITLPEEISWDYSRDNNIFSVVVSGYNVDTEYIDGIIRTQNYKPTSEDFTQLVLMLAPYSKYLLFLLFIFIIWAWIKKPFKSKKL